MMQPASWINKDKAKITRLKTDDNSQTATLANNFIQEVKEIT